MWERLASKHPRLFDVVLHGIVPAFFYFFAFCLLTFPLMGRLFTHFFADPVDGLQNVWNIWWVNQAVRRPDLYPSVWYTTLLHWPVGTTLVGHTLNPFNGYLGVLLLGFLSLKTTYNTIVVFAFVASGVTMYWLSYYLTRSTWASLIAGALFTFSSYHFAHGGNQLQTASLEWIPLFLLGWYVLIMRPGPLLAMGTALALWLVILCDYYYFTYCVLAAILIFLWHALHLRDWRFVLRREYLISLGLFAGSALLLIGPLVGNLLVSNARDPLIGAHDPANYSLDLLALIVPGGSWLFNRWTQGYWSRLPGNISENSVFIALPVFLFVGWLWMKRIFLDPAVKQQLYLWSAILVLFFLLALGPVLHIAGTVVWDGFMPYTLLGYLLPFLSLSGVPARMTVMVVLSASVLSAFALRDLLGRFPRTRLVTLGLLAVILFELLPAPLPALRIDVPDYVTTLAGLPDDGGVLNLVKTKPGLQLVYQTIHGKPIAFGYLARLPASVAAQDEDLSATIADQDYARLLATDRIRYIITSDPLPARPDQPYISVRLLYSLKGVRIYRLGCTCESDVAPSQP